MSHMDTRPRSGAGEVRGWAGDRAAAASPEDPADGAWLPLSPDSSAMRGCCKQPSYPEGSGKAV